MAKSNLTCTLLLNFMIIPKNDIFRVYNDLVFQLTCSKSFCHDPFSNLSMLGLSRHEAFSLAAFSWRSSGLLCTFFLVVLEFYEVKKLFSVEKYHLFWLYKRTFSACR